MILSAYYRETKECSFITMKQRNVALTHFPFEVIILPLVSDILGLLP